MLFRSERGWLDRATIVVFSDHGEQLGEDGIFNHCCGVGDEESHVVLMVRPPGGVKGRREDGIVELVDVMPTLLELAGATPPAGIHGRSFAAALRGEAWTGRDVAWTQGGPAMRQLGARTATGRLIWSGVPSSSPFAAPMLAAASLPGPGFTSDLPAADQDKLRAAMVAFLPTLALPPTRAATPLRIIMIIIFFFFSPTASTVGCDLSGGYRRHLKRLVGGEKEIKEEEEDSLLR